jgi:hypothetical protein
MISDRRQRRAYLRKNDEAQENHKDDRSPHLRYSLSLLLLLIRNKTGDMVLRVYTGAVLLKILAKAVYSNSCNVSTN